MAAAEQYEVLIGLLVAILALELVARRLNLPPAAAFILGGITLALIPGIPSFSIDPDLVLLIFLPPLLMNGAFFTVWREFRKNFSGILLLAVGAVAFTTLLVGVCAKALVPELPWAACFALGAILSPPDAVAASAILERLPLPARLSALLSGESLLNDASGLVLFRLAAAAALTGVFDAPAAAGSFAILSVGGIAFGFAVGHIGLFVLRRLDDSELAITATLLLAAISYIGAEQLHVSGVLSTVTTGLLLGWHQHSTFSAATRMRAVAFWKVMTFLLESLLFILIGLSLRGVLARVHEGGGAGTTLIAPALGVIAAMVASRFVWVFGSDLLQRLAQLFGRMKAGKPSFGTATVMSWAGMRGVVTLVAALSLPAAFPGRDFILLCAFAAILVTVLVQGTTLGPLVRALRLTGPEELERRQRDEDLAWKRMSQVQFETVAALSHQPDGSERHPRMVEQYGFRARVASEYTTERDAHNPLKIEHFKAVMAAIDAARADVIRMHRAGEIHDRILRDLERELDLQRLVAESHAS